MDFFIDPFADSERYFETQLQQYQFFDKYSRFDYEKGRRETWKETVVRAVNYLKEISENKLDVSDYEEIEQAILNMEVMPSMRLLATAGKAARAYPQSIYNCSFVGIDSIDSFVNVLNLSMNGVGVGFSVEHKYVDKLPITKKKNALSKDLYIIEDSTEGWCNAFYTGLQYWFAGIDLEFDYSQIRPAGSVLKTKGGRASGYRPLKELLDFTRDVILFGQHGKLSSVDVYDIVCKIGDCVVSGGHRRCLPKGSLVHTSRGAIPIEDICVGDAVMTDVGYKNVTGFFDQGKQKLLKIHFDNGKEFSCTPDHRVAVLTSVFGDYEFKQAKDLLENDAMLFISKEIDGLDDVRLNSLPGYRNNDTVRTKIKQPDLDVGTSWVIGKFLADGYVNNWKKAKKHKARTFISCNAKEVVQINRIVNWAKGLNVSTKVKKQDGNWVNVNLNNSRIARWFSSYKQPNTEIRVPKEFFLSTVENRKSFIAGVFDGDGSANNRPILVVTTIYEKFAIDIMNLLSTLGIISSMKIKKRKNGWNTQYQISIKEKSSLIKFKLIVDTYSTKSIREIKKSPHGYWYTSNFVRKDVRPMVVSGRVNMSDEKVNSSTVSEILGVDHFVPIRVDHKEFMDGEYQTYDIEVSENHVFVAEGLLVHNTAFLCLFDYDDKLMLNAKNSVEDYPHRYNANNSVVLPDIKLTQKEILHYFMQMDKYGNGEPGLFSPRAAINTVPARREINDFGLNPCGEVFLQNKQFCNLSSVVCRKDDTLDDLERKVRLAAIIGTIQSCVVNFTGLSKEYTENCQQERLLGVDLNGQMDCEIVRDKNVQSYLRMIALHTNLEYSQKLGINPSRAITTVKPSGNSGVLLNVSSGIHPRWSKYYIRNIRVSKTSPLYRVLNESGVKLNPENGQSEENATSYVVSFPMKSPDNAITRHDVSALNILEYWKQVKLNWTEHNPSCTIYYDDNEIIDVVKWLYDNQDIVSGLSFLPKFDANYPQAPYIEITKEEYEKLNAEFPKIRFDLLQQYENEDLTESAKEVACSAGRCDFKL